MTLTRTAFPPIAPRTPAEVERLARDLPTSHQSWLNDPDDAIRDYLTTPHGCEALTLALDLVDEGALQALTAKVLITEVALSTDRDSRWLDVELEELIPVTAAALVNALRLAARLIRDRVLDEDQAAEWKAADDTDQWAGTLVCAVVDQQTGPADPHVITTEEELAEAAALIGFIVAAKDRALRAKGSMDVRNPHLADLLRGRPGDLRRVLAYVRTHGMHPTRKRDVTELRDWLDTDGNTALLSGHL